MPSNRMASSNKIKNYSNNYKYNYNVKLLKKIGFNDLLMIVNNLDLLMYHCNLYFLYLL